MKNKLYVQLLSIMLVAQAVVADDYVRAVGRTLNGSNGITPIQNEKISFKDAKNLKADLKDLSSNVSKIAMQDLPTIKVKVASLKDLVEKSKASLQKSKKMKKRK